MDRRRMYSRPAQCSPLRRSIVVCGWATARSSATDGADIVLNSPPDLVLGQPEVLKDGVAAGPGAGSQHHRGRELVDRQPDVAGGDGQAVPSETAGHLAEPVRVLTEEVAERRTDAGQLTVVGGAGE